MSSCVFALFFQYFFLNMFLTVRRRRRYSIVCENKKWNKVRSSSLCGMLKNIESESFYRFLCIYAGQAGLHQIKKNQKKCIFIKLTIPRHWIKIQWIELINHIHNCLWWRWQIREVPHDQEVRDLFFSWKIECYITSIHATME